MRLEEAIWIARADCPLGGSIVPQSASLGAVEPLFIGATERGAMLLHGIVPDTD